MFSTRALKNKKSAKVPSARTRTIAFKPGDVKRSKFDKYYQQQELLFALQQISKVLTAEVNLQKILKNMATIVAKALGAKWVNFWNLTPDKKSVYIVAHYRMKPGYMEQSQHEPIKLGKAWIGRAVKTGKPWGTSDILKDPILPKELGPNWKEAIKKQNYRALLCVPLISGREIVGGICAYYRNPHEFTDFEMRLMTVAANQAATAITNAKTFGELLTERNKSIAMINSLSDGLVMYDLEYRITMLNPRSEELLWIRRSEILNKKVLELSPENLLLKNIIDISSLAIGDFETKEFLITKPQRLFLKITQAPVRDAEDRKLGSMRILHDITTEKETEELKYNFVSIASHQLRAPVARIKWVLDMFLQGELGKINPEQFELLKRLNNENELIIGLIKDFLDISRIEEGRFGYKFQLVDIVKMIEEIITGFSKDIAKRNLNVTFQRPSASLPQISADIEKLKMAIQNVIDNAIKYTLPGGKVFISFHLGTETLIVDIKDTGIGIPSDQIKFIFTRFFRARNAMHLQTEGSGLGLWIANEIIKRHNGKISFESVENEGSTFLLQFPINPSLMPKGKIEQYLKE